MILALIQEHEPVKRQAIDELLLPKLPEVLSQKQKKTKINNLLYELSVKMNQIKNTGSRKLPQWVLLKRNKKRYSIIYKFNLLPFNKINNKIAISKSEVPGTPYLAVSERKL